MTEMVTYIFLQHYWWILISLLAALLVFLLFVQGGQSMIFTLPGNDDQKTMIINAMGRKWEFTFTTLVTFGGAFFASFPLFYSTSFGGAYWVWTAVLFSFIIQAVAYEFRSKPSNFLGKKTFDVFLFINGAIGPFLLGTAVGTFFTGAFFSLDLMNNVIWSTPLHGLEALLDGRNIALGLAVLFIARVNGILYIINSVDDSDLQDRSRKKLFFNSIAFLAFFLIFAVSLLLSKGFASAAEGRIVQEKFKFLNNFLQMPVVLGIFLTGVVAVLLGISRSLFRRKSDGIWYTGTGTILTVFALFLVAGFNNTPFYPSLSDNQSSLTIQKASSSYFTLKTMMYVSFIIPFVASYIWITWRAINKKKITSEEVQGKGEGHIY